MRFAGFTTWLHGMQQHPSAGDPVAVGWRILQLISRRLDRGGALPSELEIAEVRADLESMPVAAMTPALSALLDAMDDSPTALTGALIVYARAFEDAGDYALAYDVYQLAAELGRSEYNVGLVPMAFDRMGFCLRNQDQVENASARYRAAMVLARELGDEVTELMVAVSLAKVDIHEDRYDRARLRLDEVIHRARDSARTRPLALALHDRGAVANEDEEYESALMYLGEALLLQSDAGRQLRIVNDVGSAARWCGLSEVARAAFECVWFEAAHADLSWAAAINLIAVAADDDRWGDFDRVHGALGDVAPTSRLECQLLDTLAYGWTKRGHYQEAYSACLVLREVAARRGYTKMRERAERALMGESPWRAPRSRLPLPPQCRVAIDAVMARRALVSAHPFR